MFFFAEVVERILCMSSSQIRINSSVRESKTWKSDLDTISHSQVLMEAAAAFLCTFAETVMHSSDVKLKN